MNVLPLILLEVMLPFLLLAGLGALLQRRLRFDMRTLSKIVNVYLLPAVCFAKLYESPIDASAAFVAVGFWLLLNGTLTALGAGAAKLWRIREDDRPVVRNGFVLSNQGNYGLPVSELVFAHSPLAMSVQALLSVVQNVYTYTFGTAQFAKRGRGAALLALSTAARMPVMYALAAALLCRTFGWRLPEPVWEPIAGVADAFFAIAILTLGAQLADAKALRLGRSLWVAAAGRLLLAPAAALLLIWCFRMDGPLAQALFAASSYPISRNSSLIALEYGKSPDLAAQLVVATTLLSGVTVTAVIAASQLLW
ncbi:AEC family transporter [Paenibacillus sp.]|uniref:AEC family transporter n=1 Tax=Paenibacillus sp. TaxID=58172 RepID=UPI002D57ACD7|nr:AEC family transporter [Paenibacillus sp.]HZG86123.1 AEC family transporter [Paenibacillus sp.]